MDGDVRGIDVFPIRLRRHLHATLHVGRHVESIARQAPATVFSVEGTGSRRSHPTVSTVSWPSYVHRKVSFLVTNEDSCGDNVKANVGKVLRRQDE
jgi:hypothetical protein